MSLIRVFGACLMAAFLAGSLPAAVSQPEKAEKVVSDLNDPAIKIKSDDGLPGMTNKVLQAWLKEGDATVQTKMYQAVRKFLVENDVHCTEDTTNHVLSATVLMNGLLCGPFHHVDLKIFVRKDCVTCYHLLPIEVEPDARGEVSRLLTQINHCAKLGSFGMDMVDSGSLYFEYMLPFEAIKYGGETRIAELILCGMTTIQTHGTRLWAVCAGLKTFDEVWEKTPQ